MTQHKPSFRTAVGIVLCSLSLILAGCASTPGTPTGAATSAERPLEGALPTSSVGPLPGSGKINEPLPKVELSPPAQPVRTVDLIREADDVFQRIRLGFAMPDINNDLVLYHQQWYMNRPDYLRRMAERATPFMHHIVEELDKRGMPMELALLPMVESAFNPTALSRAKASGLWQFIPATGKRYNLDQNWWKDERRDIVASTTAALDYLQTIYEMHGDWHLALASYNWGEGAVARAVNRNRAQDLPTDYLSLSMPQETRNYVPKLQALKNIFSNPGTLSELGIPRIPNRPYFATISAPTNIDVKVAAKLAEMPVQEFVALNPAHHRPVITTDSPMVIPTEKYETFVSNLEAHEEDNKPLSSWQTYTLRPGDRLESVAPRFGMTVANLRAVNGIKGQIKPGLTLLVANKDYNGKPDMTPLPGQPRLPDADPEPAARSHTVRKGETLTSIAKRYGTTTAILKRLNDLRSEKVTIGSRLSIPGVSKKAAATPTTSRKSATPATSSKVAPQAVKQKNRTSGKPVKAAKPAKPTSKRK